MKLLTFYGETGLQLGLKTAQGVLNVAQAAKDLNLAVPNDMTGVLNAGLTALKPLAELADKAESSHWLPEETLKLGPCVPQPGKIICVGLNYRRHAKESGLPVPETPILFNKFNNGLAASHENVPLPANASQYDYEAELVIVMGKRAKYVSPAEALDYVFGYCNGNDLSARDLQTRTSQWMLGKTPDKFLPIGPYLVTADEVGDPQNLSIKSWVNGDLRQNSNTADMIFGVAEVVSYISQHLTLEAGDLILTGTPEGVVLGRPQKDWLVPGDEATVEIAKLGTLTNKMVAEEI